MKILFCPCHYIYDENKEGSEIAWAFNIADRISRKHKNSVVVTGKKNFQEKKEYTIIELQKYKQNIDLSVINALKFNLLYYFQTIKQVGKDKVDIIHHVLPFSLDTTFNIFAILNNSRNKIPFIIGPIQNPLTIKDDDLDPSNVRNKKEKVSTFSISLLIIKIFKPILKVLSDKTLQKATKIIVINSYTQKILLEKNIAKNNIHIIPPGIDTNKFKYISSTKKPKQIIEILTVSYLLKRKGIDLILKALAEVVKSNTNIKLRIVGSGPQDKNLKNMVHQLKLDYYVVFEGFIRNSEVHKYYSRAHIYISMSRSEGFATVALEAMASGLAVISSKVGGFQDIIQNGVNGYIVNQEDYKTLAKRINYLINHTKIIDEFSKKGRKDIENNYDWNKIIIPKYLALYKSILNK